MSFISGISDDTVNFEEIAVLLKYLSPKVGFLCPRHNNQAVISYQYSTLGHTYNIPSDVLKADIGATTDVLYSVLNEIWDKEEIPTEWKTIKSIGAQCMWR